MKAIKAILSGQQWGNPWSMLAENNRHEATEPLLKLPVDNTNQQQAIGYLVLNSSSVYHNPVRISTSRSSVSYCSSFECCSPSQSTPIYSPLGTCEEVIRCGLLLGFTDIFKASDEDGVSDNHDDGNSPILLQDDAIASNSSLRVHIRESAQERPPYNRYSSHKWIVTIEKANGSIHEVKSGDTVECDDLEGRIFFPVLLEQESALIPQPRIYQPSKQSMDLRHHVSHWDSLDEVGALNAKDDSSHHILALPIKSHSASLDSKTMLKLYSPDTVGHLLRSEECVSTHSASQRDVSHSTESRSRQSWDPSARFSWEQEDRFSFEEMNESSDTFSTQPAPSDVPPLPLIVPISEETKDNSGVFTWVASRRKAEGGLYQGFERAKMMKASGGFSFMVPLASHPAHQV